MKYLIAILFVGVLFRHYVPQMIWEGTGISYQGWFYIFGGLLEVLFCLCMLYAARNAKKLVIEWGAMRNYERRLCALIFAYVVIIGVLEGLQISVCRLAITNFGDVPKLAYLCDFAIVANINYLLGKVTDATWLRIDRLTIPFTTTVYTTYYLSFIYHYAKILREGKWKRT